MDVLGRRDGSGPVASLGHFRARDGSRGGAVGLDLNRPHAALVVGKRGSGKSYTLGVLAEELARCPGIAPVIIDPMGAFTTLANADTGIEATVESDPTICADTLSARSWCGLFNLDPAGAVGSLLWQAASATASLDAMETFLEKATVDDATRRAAQNHLALAREWDIFSDDGLTAGQLCSPDVTILDCSGLADPPMNAVCRAVAETLYRARIDGTS